MVVMDIFTRRIIGFGVERADLCGASVCRMFNQIVARQSLPQYLSSDHDPVAVQEYRFAAEQIDAPQAILHMPDKTQPGGAVGSCLGSIVFREHPADDVFVNIDAKGVRNLLCDAGTANTGIAALELDDRVDEFLRWPFWSGSPMASRREKPPIFALLQGFMKSQ